MGGSFFNQTQEAVYKFLDQELPEYAGISEIGCGKISAKVFAQMLEKGRISSYQGFDIRQDAVKIAESHGLEASLVTEDTPLKEILSRATASELHNPTVVMLGLSEVAPDTAKEYTKLVEQFPELKIVSYPEI